MGGKRFIPTTFEERGVAAPFTTPVLSQARVRKDYRERLEAVVPNITDGFGNYVVPWSDLPEIASMTVHDRMLYRLISKISATTSESMRTVAAVVAKTGLAGPDIATRTSADEAEDRELYQFVHAVMVARLMQVRGRPAMDLLRLAGTDQGWEMAASEVRLVEKQLGIAGRGFGVKFDEICGLAIQVGLPRTQQPGRLRSLVEGLREMSQTLRRWTEEDRTDASVVAIYVAETAEDTLRIAEPLLGDIDRKLGDAGRILAQTDVEIEGLRRHMAKLAWLVDGWDHLIAWWNRSLQAERREQVTAISGIFRVLPLVPKAEMRPEDAARAQLGEDPKLPPGVILSARRLVHAIQNWRAGDLDYSLVQAIEEIRATAL